jgi:hypothetical protein
MTAAESALQEHLRGSLRRITDAITAGETA